jgi:hypothetical protein
MTDTLKSICEQCIHLHNPQLDFISEQSQRQKDIILRDLKELVAAASLESEKSVIVLAGGLLESVLYGFIQTEAAQIAARRGSFTFNPDHNLGNYASIFNRWFSSLLTIPDTAVDYRDIVHINRELNYPPDICSSASRELIRLLDTLLGKLAQYASI